MPGVAVNNPQDGGGCLSPAGIAPEAPPAVLRSVFNGKITRFLKPGAPSVRGDGGKMEMLCYVTNETKDLAKNNFPE